LNSQPHFSSTTAFVALYEALRKSVHRSETEEALFRALVDVLASMRPEERAALDSALGDPATKRHRERAIAHLERELAIRGIIDR